MNPLASPDPDGSSASVPDDAAQSVPDDASLLERHLAGEPHAFSDLIRRHQNRLWSVALRITANREEAADAVQDALISAYRNASQFRGQARVSTWLHRIVINACLSRLRARRPTSALPNSDDLLPAAGDDFAASDAAITLQAGLAQLPPDQRAAIVLVDIEGYPVAEAALLLGVAVGTIKSRCARARARLAELINPELRNLAPTSGIQTLSSQTELKDQQ